MRATCVVVLTPLSLDNLGQLTQMLWLFWSLGVSIALARSPRHARIPVVAPGV